MPFSEPQLIAVERTTAPISRLRFGTAPGIIADWLSLTGYLRSR